MSAATIQGLKEVVIAAYPDEVREIKDEVQQPLADKYRHIFGAAKRSSGRQFQVIPPSLRPKQWSVDVDECVPIWIRHIMGTFSHYISRLQGGPTHETQCVADCIPWTEMYYLKLAVNERPDQYTKLINAKYPVMISKAQIKELFDGECPVFEHATVAVSSSSFVPSAAVLSEEKTHPNPSSKNPQQSRPDTEEMTMATCIFLVITLLLRNRLKEMSHRHVMGHSKKHTVLQVIDEKAAKKQAGFPIALEVFVDNNNGILSYGGRKQDDYLHSNMEELLYWTITDLHLDLDIPSTRYGWTPLILSIQTRSTILLTRLLELQVSSGYREVKSGYCIWHRAAMSAVHAPGIEFLLMLLTWETGPLKQGTSLLTRDYKGQTVLDLLTTTINELETCTKRKKIRQAAMKKMSRKTRGTIEGPRYTYYGTRDTCCVTAGGRSSFSVQPISYINDARRGKLQEDHSDDEDESQKQHENIVEKDDVDQALENIGQRLNDFSHAHMDDVFHQLAEDDGKKLTEETNEDDDESEDNDNDDNVPGHFHNGTEFNDGILCQVAVSRLRHVLEVLEACYQTVGKRTDCTIHTAKSECMGVPVAIGAMVSEYE